MIFWFENYSDLIDKIKYERSLVNTSSESKKLDIYPLFNIVLTLNHIFEWFYKDNNNDNKLRVECIKIFNTYEYQEDQKRYYEEFLSLLNIPLKPNPNQLLIRQLANDIKHFKVRNISDAEKKPLILSVANNMCAGGYNAYAGYHEEYKYIISTMKGEEFNLISIIDDLIYKWVDFIYSTRAGSAIHGTS